MMLCGDFVYDTNFKRAKVFLESLHILHLLNLILESIYSSIYLLLESRRKRRMANSKFLDLFL